MTISIPINITIPAGGGAPYVGTIAAPATDDLPDQAVYVGPLQQELELMKQQGGKTSKVSAFMRPRAPHWCTRAHTRP